MRRIALALAVAAAISGILWLFARRSVEGQLDRLESTRPDFDLVYQLPGSPIGAATNGRELVIGNRKDPWGVMRLRRERNRLRAEILPIFQTPRKQTMDLHALAWDGTFYVGYASAAWFGGKEGYVFTIHDPTTMRVIDHQPAPDMLGCLAWDGRGFWAATRRNTAAEKRPAKLYKLDRYLEVVSVSEPPGVGCQGLAWDGKRLWFADVFSEEISVLDVSGPQPRVVHAADSGMESLSGIVWFEDDIWVTEYADHRLHRLRTRTRLAWANPEPGERPAARRATRERPGPAAALMPSNVVRSARYENTTSRRADDDAEILNWSLELRDDGLFGSWRMWYGPGVFARAETTSTEVTAPQFAQYTITVHQPAGEKEIRRTFDASPGEHVMNDVRLADAEKAGRYRVDIVLNVQYVTPDGKPQIVNRSGTRLEVQR